MILMHRNLKPAWYALWERTEDVTDSDGLKTGEKRDVYGDPVRILCNISPARGYAQQEVFGNLDNYDFVLVVSDMSCPVDDSSVFWLSADPTEQEVPYECRVRRVAKSLNHITIALRKVDVS